MWVVHAAELSRDAVIPHISTKLSATGGLHGGGLGAFGWALVHNIGVVFLLWNGVAWNNLLLYHTDISFST